MADRRVRPNPKYQGVGPRLDSGNNMRKVMKSYEGTSGPNAHKSQARPARSPPAPLPSRG